ncbi:hypothetical protein PC9H_008883 [Pleurotus ostreatus]|uniref:HNH nuclease domain-containing protein n=2 Tax=Pleurotus TaxID=5320 RepID=A0A8H6ZS50_PLEOS|nr:uncharacterized protein PC9H_008883 [Pleurotus ostreatus]KAF7426514.1 hypothetical protein PC9H_008883 [Pleurotus ostreatus]KAG9221994.1 hypothetical protein CCMSSC00406_0009202 [Pleurotus cornucopiae]KAJ8694070.1 hypothetical protein PTI98_009003 [Pleurotus ostreatus]
MILSDGEVGFNQSAVVDMRVAAARRTASCTSATTANRRDTDFREKIQRRDEMCVFTSWDGQACHIIPHSRGDQQIQMLSEERLILPSIQDIGDLRNGIMLCDTLHGFFDKRLVAVLVTPNAILAREDVPQADHPCNPADLRPALLDMRYTLQIINLNDSKLHRLEHNYAPNNRDAKFKDARPTSLPEASLLHYLYGAAILTAFGRSGVVAWQASGNWRTPRKQSYPATRSFNARTLENCTLTRAKREGTSPYSSESKLAGGHRITADEALDYMSNITSRQLAYREQAQWAQHKLEIDAWVSGCAEGNPGRTKQGKRKGGSRK